MFPLIFCYVIISCIIISFSCIFSYEAYTMWIKKGFLMRYFPKWEGTNKGKCWWLGWSIAVFFGIIPFTISVFVFFPSPAGVLASFFIIYVAYLCILGFIYVCVKNWRKEKQ